MFLYKSQMTTKTYANFNSASFQGRIFDATVAEGQYGEFVAITVITNLSDDTDGVTITFNSSGGLLALAKKGYLTNGRMVHVTGHISGVTEVYETEDGTVQLLKRPRLMLDPKTAQLVLGAQAKADAPQRPMNAVVKRPVQPLQDKTPAVAENF